jgi:hypothetical protein
MVRVVSPGGTINSGPGTVAGLQAAKLAVHCPKPHMVITCASGIVLMRTWAFSQYSAAPEVPGRTTKTIEAESKNLIKLFLILMDMISSSSRFP